MAIWPRRLRERVEYVPIALADKRTREERWADTEYLRALQGLAGNTLYLSEVSDALAECRTAADTAKTPEELAGIQVGIRLLRRLLTVSAAASQILRAQREIDGDASNSLG